MHLRLLRRSVGAGPCCVTARVASRTCVFGCRLIAQQTEQIITPHCGQAGNSYPQCNCSRNSILMPPSAPSLRYIGRQPVMCPYYYYTEPRAECPGSTPCGYWYSLPKAGECSSSDGHPPGVSGTCTWSRQPFATIAYGDDLLHEGFDKRLSFGFAVVLDDQSGGSYHSVSVTTICYVPLGCLLKHASLFTFCITESVVRLGALQLVQ